MNHFPERKLKPDDTSDGTWVVWAREPPRNAVVFVHGYKGSAIPTWTRFESELPLRPRAKNYDLFFYGYNCYSSNTTAEGRLLCAFLEEMSARPLDVARASLPRAAERPTSFCYERIVLVG